MDWVIFTDPKITHRDHMMKHLQLRRRRYYLHWNVPAELRDHPFFSGRAIYTKTLETSDLQQARRMRDTIVAEFNELLERVRAAPRRHRFNHLLAEIRQPSKKAAATAALTMTTNTSSMRMTWKQQSHQGTS